MAKNYKKILTLRLETENVEKLEKLAKIYNIKFSGVLRNALLCYFNETTKERHTRAGIIKNLLEKDEMFKFEDYQTVDEIVEHLFSILILDLKVYLSGFSSKERKLEEAIYFFDKFALKNQYNEDKNIVMELHKKMMEMLKTEI